MAMLNTSIYAFLGYANRRMTVSTRLVRLSWRNQDRS
jgi:hypothetical protein